MLVLATWFHILQWMQWLIHDGMKLIHINKGAPGGKVVNYEIILSYVINHLYTVDQN